jgi:hypothetical protein
MPNSLAWPVRARQLAREALLGYCHERWNRLPIGLIAYRHKPRDANVASRIGELRRRKRFKNQLLHSVNVDPTIAFRNVKRSCRHHWSISNQREPLHQLGLVTRQQLKRSRIDRREVSLVRLEQLQTAAMPATNAIRLNEVRLA